MKKLVLSLMVISGMTFAFFDDALIKNNSGSDLVYSIKVDGEWGSWSFLDDGDELEIPIEDEVTMFRYYEGENIRYFELSEGMDYHFRQKTDGKGIALFEAEPVKEKPEITPEAPKKQVARTPEPKKPITTNIPEVPSTTVPDKQVAQAPVAPIHLGPVIHHDPFYCPPGQIIYERPVFAPFGGFFRRRFR